MVIEAYARGERPARDVVAVLDALAAARRFACLRAVLRHALAAVRPVPMVLWRWVRDNARAASLEHRTALRRAGLYDPRVERMLRLEPGQHLAVGGL